MGFFKACTSGKVYTFILGKRGRKELFPLQLFQLVKLSLMGCSPAEPMSVSLYKSKYVHYIYKSKLRY
jgi:hypothetical protein